MPPRSIGGRASGNLSIRGPEVSLGSPRVGTRRAQSATPRALFFFRVLDLTAENNPPHPGRERDLGRRTLRACLAGPKWRQRDRTFLPGHAAHCPSLPDSPRGRSALRLLRASRRRLIGLTLVFASSNCSTGEPDRPIQGFALMLPSPHRHAVGPNKTARRPPSQSIDVDSVAPVGLVSPYRALH